ncbi:MAG: hypothetical protein F6K31_32370 [Symploca sp. SIO2G7]|nr:hypothetical protein [Symploca sp. SIO2G7]
MLRFYLLVLLTPPRIFDLGGDCAQHFVQERRQVAGGRWQVAPREAGLFLIFFFRAVLLPIPHSPFPI